MRALLAAADAPTRDLLDSALRDRGWDVTTAADGAEAWASFQNTPFPLVVLSTALPSLDGNEVCRRIRAHPATAHVLFVTRPAPDVLRALASSGADDYLTTPVSAPELDARLMIAARRLRTASAAAELQLCRDKVLELQETLVVQTAFLEELFESAPEGIAVVDAEDRILRVNREFSRMFGYSRPEALGRPMNDLIARGDLREDAMCVTVRVLQGERIEHETVRCRKDDSRLHVSLLAAPVRVGGGQRGTYAIYRDVTQQKEAEAALRNSERRYRALFDQSPVGVFLCDAESRITHCNQRLLEILDAPRDQIIGMNVTRLSDPRVRPAVRHAVDSKSALQEAWYEGPYRAGPDAREIWISARVSPLRSESSRPVGAMGLVEDITDRVHAEARLRAQTEELEHINAELRQRTDEVEAAMQARSRLYARMNHELRTPISAIMLYNELLLGGTLGPMAPEQVAGIKRSQDAAQHLLELVHDILDLSKIEAGKVVVEPVEVDLPELVEDLFATVLPLAESHGSELRVEQVGELRTLETDPRRLRQILLNLFSNAVKFGRSRPITVRYMNTAAGGVAIEVADQGVGIAPDNLHRIFEDFVQVGSAQEGGTGLGLAISRRLTKLLGGTLQVESVPGVGSTFRVTLPPQIPSNEFPDAPNSY
jgi:PAS domain S-box-containing protein